MLNTHNVLQWNLYVFYFLASGTTVATVGNDEFDEPLVSYFPVPGDHGPRGSSGAVRGHPDFLGRNQHRDVHRPVPDGLRILASDDCPQSPGFRCLVLHSEGSEIEMAVLRHRTGLTVVDRRVHPQSHLTGGPLPADLVEFHRKKVKVF